MNRTTTKPFSLGRWVSFTFLGWLLGVALILLLSSFLDSIGIEGMQFYLGLGMGAGVGFTQWFFLKKIIPINLNWIWFSALGMGVPFIIFDLMGTPSTYKLPVSIALGALSVGLLQFMLLKKHLAQSHLWILGCFIGWTLAVLTVFTIDYTKHLSSFIHSNLVLAFINLLLILAGGLVLGFISGLVLKRLLNLQPPA